MHHSTQQQDIYQACWKVCAYLYMWDTDYICPLLHSEAVFLIKDMSSTQCSTRPVRCRDHQFRPTRVPLQQRKVRNTGYRILMSRLIEKRMSLSDQDSGRRVGQENKALFLLCSLWFLFYWIRRLPEGRCQRYTTTLDDNFVRQSWLGNALIKLPRESVSFHL